MSSDNLICTPKQLALIRNSEEQQHYVSYIGENIPDELMSNPEIRSFTAINCVFEKASFGGLPELTQLTVVSCNLRIITTLPSGLENLNVEHNHLSVIPACAGLLQLDIRDNRFQNWNSVCPRLKTLFVDEDVHFSFVCFPILSSLNGREFVPISCICVIPQVIDDVSYIQTIQEHVFEDSNIRIGEKDYKIPSFIVCDSAIRTETYQLMCIADKEAIDFEACVNFDSAWRIALNSLEAAKYYTSISVFELECYMNGNVTEAVELIKGGKLVEETLLMKDGPNSMHLRLSRVKTHENQLEIKIMSNGRILVDYAQFLRYMEVKLIQNGSNLHFSIDGASAFILPERVKVHWEERIDECVYSHLESNMIAIPKHCVGFVFLEILFSNAAQNSATGLFWVASNTIFLTELICNQLVRPTTETQTTQATLTLDLCLNLYMSSSGGENTVFSRDRSFDFVFLTTNRYFGIEQSENNGMLVLKVIPLHCYSFLVVLERDSRSVGEDIEAISDATTNTLKFRIAQKAVVELSKKILNLKELGFLVVDVLPHHESSNAECIQCSQYRQVLLCAMSDLCAEDVELSAGMLNFPYIDYSEFDMIERITTDRATPWKMNYRQVTFRTYFASNASIERAYIVDSKEKRKSGQIRGNFVVFDLTEQKKKPRAAVIEVKTSRNEIVLIWLSFSSGIKVPVLAK